MTPKLYEPLTPELATALIAQVDMVPKQKPCEIGIPNVYEDGSATVTVRTQSSTTAIQTWFMKCGLMVTWFQMTLGAHTWICHFRLMATEGEGR